MKINKLLKYTFISVFILCSLLSCSRKETTNFRSKEKEVNIKSEIKQIGLTAEQIKKYKPNEMGKVIILEYHLIGYPEARLKRTPENFEKDLERLYKDNYYLVPLRDFVNNKMNVPLGKTPVILTFDDGTRSQFNYIKNGSKLIIDPKCGLGIIENFIKKHSDFGKGATFYVLPRLPFGQKEYIAKKLKFLADNGYEIGNHTLNHKVLRRLTDEKAQREIALNIFNINKYLPNYEINTIAFPYGSAPKNLKLVMAGKYGNLSYKNIAGLLAGANPSFSPNSIKFNPVILPRVQGFQKELDKWLGVFDKYKDFRYISDGDINTITIPKKFTVNLKPELKNSKNLVTY